MALSTVEKERYARHLILNEIGIVGQAKLKEANVLVIGAGGLGSPVLLYLAAAGIGHIGIADADVVDISNLQRQVIHTTNDIGIEKVLSAMSKMEAINPNIKIETYHTFFDNSNAKEIMKDYDIVIDATDNSKSKFFINDVCVKYKKPYIHGAVREFSGKLMTYIPGSACYRCLFPIEPTNTPAGSTIGVMGVVPGVIGVLQATEAIKFITGIGELLTNKVLLFDALSMDFNIISIAKRDSCVCTIA